MREFLIAANGKVRIDKGILNPKTKTLQLQTGPESGYLALDVDDPSHHNNKLLLKVLDRDNFFVYSSEYTLDDVFKGKCRYKVVYRYNGTQIPFKRVNKAIEVFYQPRKYVAIAGMRDDGYEYKFSGTVSYIHFDINDFLETNVPFDLMGATQAQRKAIPNEDNEESTILDLNENVDIAEFKRSVTAFVKDLPVIKKKGDSLLTFECLFPHTHTSKNYGYAFKKDGIYIAKCQGEACSHEYKELNKNIKNSTLNTLSFDNSAGFDVEDGINVFLAPTGWGKTEKIAEEALKVINQHGKLLILLQNKEAINRLLDRIDDKSGGYTTSLLESGRIFVYTAENKTDHFAEDVANAHVIISHHYYFKNAGDVLTYFPSSDFILKQKNLEVIVDEAHSFIELASRLDLDIGGTYDLRTFNGVEIFLKNYTAYSKDDANNKPSLHRITACVEGYVSDFGTITLQRQNKVYKDISYMDLVSDINDRMEFVSQFREDNYLYRVYKNPNVQPIKANNVQDAGSASDLLLNSSEHLVIAINEGDDYKRRKVGDISLTIYHSQNLQQLLRRPKKVILTTATMNQYHKDILGRHCKYTTHTIKEDIKKIGKIVLLRANDSKASRMRNKVLETVNTVNSRSLLFFPTIDKAKAVLHDYENAMLNDNGFYVVGKRKSHNDFVDNMGRNVTLAGLESSVAKGYNYLEEVETSSYGFELIYFDSSPVSPQIVKKYIDDNGKLEDYENDYNISVFAQAIGRALRKQKETLTLAINSIDTYSYEMIKTYLRTYTNAELLEDDLNITNIKVSLSGYLRQFDMRDLRNRLRSNNLFQRLYGEKEWK